MAVAAAGAQVKNTFVHVADAAAPARLRGLRRCQTDPDGRDEPSGTNTPVSTFADESSEQSEQESSSSASLPGHIRLPEPLDVKDECSSLAGTLTVPTTPEPSPRRWAPLADYQWDTPPPQPRSASWPEGAGEPCSGGGGGLLGERAAGFAAPSPQMAGAWALPSWSPEQLLPTAMGCTAPTPGIVVFCFALRLADNSELGLDVQCYDRFLVVRHVLRGGAVEAWNRQCLDGTANALMGARAVYPGDTIVAINGATDSREMLHACRRDKLLRLVVARRDMSLFM